MDTLLFVSYQLSAVSFQLKAKNLKNPKAYAFLWKVVSCCL